MAVIEYVKNLYPIFTKPKRIKIIVGGRGSTKSTGIADYVAARISTGELWCCARENQNSIEESVHRTILDEVARLGLTGFADTKTSITHWPSGGRAFYRGLARNISSLKSTLSGIDGLWIEEGEDLSVNTLRVLTASVRLNATDSQRLISGEDVRMPEILITMNRGMRNGAVAKKWLHRADADLQRCGYYEDDAVMVVEMNYTDMPESWFLASGLEEERKDDKKQMSAAMYRHKWLGEYLDEVDLAIIQQEWFAAAIDAHEKLGFKPIGAKVVSHDPSDSGFDAKGLAYRWGSVVLDVAENTGKDVNAGCDWATDYATDVGADYFTWDCDGLGVSLRRQVSQAFNGTRTSFEEFKGSHAVDRPNQAYDQKATGGKPKTNKDTFRNKRSQYYWGLRDRFYKTYRAVEHGEYIDPDEMISLSSKIEGLDKLRAEICGIPMQENHNGLIQIMSKKDMKRIYGVESPNMADSLYMCFGVNMLSRSVRRRSANIPTIKSRALG